MGFLINVVVLASVCALSLYYYNSEVFFSMGQQGIDTVKNRSIDFYDDYYNALHDLASKPEKKYAFYAQVLALGMLVYVAVFKRSYDPSKKGYGGRAPSPLSKQEQDALIEDWQPQPLINLNIDTRPNNLGAEHVLESRLGSTAQIRGIDTPVLNLAGFDFLGMSQEEDIREQCKESLINYGCGSCGPRGFYGTSDKHLQLEQAIANFFGTEEAIVYSDAACTMSSIIPAFAKRGDVIVADVAVSESAIAGIELSRSTVRYFKHNDVADMAKHLEALNAQLRRKGKPLNRIRRYVVVEGLYRNIGDFAPLVQIIACARRYKYRVILDDSYAIGTVGATGRGSLERANLKPTDVDFLAGSLAFALGSVGGFCTGTHVAVDHQRLAGSGYCFSASAPPFTCVAAMEALRIIDDDTDRLARLRRNIALARELAGAIPGLRLVSEEESPMLYLQLEDSTGGGGSKRDAPLSRDERFALEEKLQEIADLSLDGFTGSGGRRTTRSSAASSPTEDGLVPDGRLLVTRARSVYPPARAQRPPLPVPSLRVCVSSLHTEAQLRQAFSTLTQAAESVLEE